MVTMLEFIVGIVLLIIGVVLTWCSLSSKDEDTHLFGLIIGIIMVIIGILIIVFSIIVIIEPGNVGVVTTLGSLDNNQLDAGLHIINPLSSVTVFSIRTVSDSQTEDVLTSDGLTVTQDLTILYRANSSGIAMLYKETGPNYKDTVLDPVIRSVVRDVTAKYSVQGVYNDTTRNSMTELVKKGIEPEFTKRGVVVESVLMRKPKLPSEVETAIKNKITAEQMILQKQYEIETATKNAEIKRQDAYGIADANKIISDSITPSYIEWYTIEMMKDHKSDSMMFVPVGSNGIPMVTNLPLINKSING